MTGAPQAIAEGSLTQTPFLHVLISVEQRKLTGTLAVWPDDGTNRPDRIWFEDGAARAATLIDAASSLEQGLLPIFRRTKAPYAFYEANVLAGAQVIKGRVDPWAVAVSALRGGAREDIVDAVLARWSTQPIRLKPRVPLQRFELDSKERAFVDLILAESAPVATLVGASGDERLAKRLLYLFSLTDNLAAAAHRPSPPPPKKSYSRIPPPPAEEPELPGFPSEPPLSSPAEAHLLAEAHAEAQGVNLTRSSTVPPPAPADSIPPPPVTLSPDAVTRWNEVTQRAREIDNQTYFQMLSVEENAEEQAIRNAYFAQVKAWHPDRLPAEIEILKPWAERIFRHLTDAMNTLADAEERIKYIKAVRQGGGTPKSARHVAAIVNAAVEFQKVEVLVRRREWEEALKSLEIALATAPEDPDYMSMKAFILFHQHGIKDEAKLRQMKKFSRVALENDPKCQRAHYTQGLILKCEGRDEAALQHFRTVVQLNPKHLEATREVRLAEMRKRKRIPSPAGAQPVGNLLSKLFSNKK